MRSSSLSSWRHVPPPSSERNRPLLPMTNTRCAFVFCATATYSQPFRRGKPPPVTSVQVMPSSLDLKSRVVGAGGGDGAAPATGADGGGKMPDGGTGALKCRIV